MWGRGSSQGRFVQEAEAVRDGESVVTVSDGGPLGSGNIPSPGEGMEGEKGRWGRGGTGSMTGAEGPVFTKTPCTLVAWWDTKPGSRVFSLFLYNHPHSFFYFYF